MGWLGFAPLRPACLMEKIYVIGVYVNDVYCDVHASFRYPLPRYKGRVTGCRGATPTDTPLT